MLNLKYFVLLSAVVSFSKAASLPSYSERCCVDANMNSCMLKNIQHSIHAIALGDGHYNTPGLMPLRVPKIQVLDNDNGFFVLSSVTAYGFAMLQLIDIDFDLISGNFNAQYAIPMLEIISNYDINITNTPIVGFGAADITLQNISLDHNFHVSIDDDGYPRLRKPTVNYSVQSVTYKMGNMDPSANNYMNEHPGDLSILFRPQVKIAFSDVVSWTYEAINDMVKITDIFNFNCPTTTTTSTTTTPSTTTTTSTTTTPTTTTTRCATPTTAPCAPLLCNF